MAQVTRTTNDIIVNSLYLIGELGVGESPDSFMLSTGLELINEILAKFSADEIYIPFLKEISFPFVTGKSVYTISNIVPADITDNRIVSLNYATYTVQTSSSEPIVYPLHIINEAAYYNITRLNNLQARPGFVYFNKLDNRSVLTFYPAPDKTYLCTLQAKFMLNSLGPQENIIELAPLYYGFLKYAVAKKFMSYYPSANWPQSNEDEYQDYYSILKNSNNVDMTINPSSLLDSPEPFYWANILAYS